MPCYLLLISIPVPLLLLAKHRLSIMYVRKRERESVCVCVCVCVCVANLINTFQVAVQIVQGDLTTPFVARLQNRIDVIVCNPPYVPSSNEDDNGDDGDSDNLEQSTKQPLTSTTANTPFGCGIEASWDGGAHGRVVIDRMLPLIPV
jgi:23S rRNA A1618 N6-methylase RlmF